MSCMNSTTREFWNDMGQQLSRQRPSCQRIVTIVQGRKARGRRGVVVKHMIDKYENAYRYGNETSHHMRDMQGREGWVCRVRLDSGEEIWVKARYLVCDYLYEDCWTALADAIRIGYE